MSTPTQLPEDRLVAAGLLPGWPPPGQPHRTEAAMQGDLLPQLVAAWREAVHDARGQRRKDRAKRMRDWLQIRDDEGCRLTWGIPGPNQALLADWLGPRLAWWPQGIPRGSRVAVASSRLGRKLEARRSWFAVLRAACARLDPEDDILLVSKGTTTARYVERCGDLFGLRLLGVQTWGRDEPTWARWWRRIRQATAVERDRFSIAQVYLSPALGPADRCPAPSPWAACCELPVRDRVLVGMGEKLVVLHVRNHGVLHQLLRARLDDTRWSPTSVRIALGQNLTHGELADELLGNGALGWLVLNTLKSEVASSPVRLAPARAMPRAPISQGISPSIPDDSRGAPWDYLTHCTRRRDGPWPDQNEEDYLDDLILQREGMERSALATLKRIITQRRLIASSQSIRGGTPVVSFTSVPLAALRPLRVFRPHRSRWDFESYGICIHRSWLQQRNIQPVRYAPDSHWDRIPREERPYFQRDRSRTGSCRTTIDWTVEHEWRHVGDLPLEELPPDLAFVFVPTPEEAAQLSPFSRWPVVVLSH